MQARWANLWQKLGQFDTLTELQASGDRTLIGAHAKLLKALTSEADGRPLAAHNEVKLNNSTVVGFGLMRRGRTVTFEGLDAASRAILLGDKKAPPWLITEPKPNSVLVPKTLWQEAARLRLPLVVVDSH